ncbi:hypothetical protein CEXT_489391 [Caerostris extrusa]|uniref:Uncharacterized protein n=1 Tax=Caerostris extrusa TaxID=172846 RepID=A0AAV4TBD6_CAEEX|nr:hypothetical protein CEXT_489391 [Caerostris extrusa]
MADFGCMWIGLPNLVVVDVILAEMMTSHVVMFFVHFFDRTGRRGEYPWRLLFGGWASVETIVWCPPISMNRTVSPSLLADRFFIAIWQQKGIANGRRLPSHPQRDYRKVESGLATGATAFNIQDDRLCFRPLGLWVLEAIRLTGFIAPDPSRVYQAHNTLALARGLPFQEMRFCVTRQPECKIGN